MQLKLWTGKRYWPLLMPDAGGEVEDRIRTFIPNWASYTPNAAYQNQRITSRSCEPVQPLEISPGLPEPSLGLNQLYIPSGAHRWAKMYALLPYKAVEEMYDDGFVVPKIYPTNKTRTGLFWSSNEKKLTSRGLTVPEDFTGFLDSVFISRVAKLSEGDDSIALVELVDDRYTWQKATLPYIIYQDLFGVAWNWKSLGNALRDALLWPDAVSYLNPFAFFDHFPGEPDRTYLHRPGESAALILEAALRSFGLTIAPNRNLANQLDGDFRLFSGTNNTGEAKVQNTIFNYYFAGIDLVCQAMVNGKPRYDLPAFVHPMPNPALPSIYANDPNYKRIRIHSSMFARFNSASDISLNYPPSNLSEIVEIGQYVLDIQLQGNLFNSGTLKNATWTNFSGSSKFLSSFVEEVDYIMIDFANGGIVSTEPYRPVSMQLTSYAVDRQFVKHCEETIRVQLVEDLPVCSNAVALQLTDQPGEDCPCGSLTSVLVIDTAGIARTRISNGERYAPAQSMGFAKQLRCGDSGEPDVYELISVGQGCCPPPGASEYEDCCQQWFTRFEDLQTVSSKQVGEAVSYGETIGTSKSDGFRYKAFLSNSLSGDGCAIDVSGIHSYSMKNSRSSGTSPCTPSATECAINYARLKMAGKKPFDDSLCQDAFEDLSDAGTGDNYYRRKIVGRPSTCISGKKLYNFTAARTTILTKGADYIVLKHECEPASSSSSDGVDSCCVVMTDYDLQCISGKLQKFQRQTEVCWDGDCLVTKSVLPWTYTGQQVGCCDCAAGSGESSGGVASSGSSEGGTVLTSCCPDNPVPESLTVVISGGACAGTYSMTYNAGLDEWISGDFDGLLRMTCESFGWYLNLNMEGYSPVTVNCNPFSLTFTVIGDPICGSFTMTITG